jgi:hypothetical protein
MTRRVKKGQEPDELPWFSRTLFPTIWHFLYMNIVNSTVEILLKSVAIVFAMIYHALIHMDQAKMWKHMKESLAYAPHPDMPRIGAAAPHPHLTSQGMRR